MGVRRIASPSVAASTDRDISLNERLGCSPEAKLVILSCDDLGSCHAANEGVYQAQLNPNHPYQLIRIALPSGVPYFAELSGGRHRFTARFLEFSAAEDRTRQTVEDVDFELACCLI